MGHLVAFFAAAALVAMSTEAFAFTTTHTVSSFGRRNQVLSATNDADALGFEVELSSKPKLVRPLSLTEELPQPFTPDPSPVFEEPPTVAVVTPSVKAVTADSSGAASDAEETVVLKEPAGDDAENSPWNVLSSMTSTTTGSAGTKGNVDIENDDSTPMDEPLKGAEEVLATNGATTATEAAAAPTFNSVATSSEAAETETTLPPPPSPDHQNEQQSILASILGHAPVSAATAPEEDMSRQPTTPQEPPIQQQQQPMPPPPPSTGLSKYVEMQSAFKQQPSSSYPQQQQYRQTRQQIMQRQRPAAPQPQPQAAAERPRPQARAAAPPQQSYMASYDALDKFTSSRSSFGYMKQPHEIAPNESQVRKHQAYLASRDVARQKRALPQPAMVDSMGSFVETRSSFGTMKQPHEEYLEQQRQQQMMMQLSAAAAAQARALNPAPQSQPVPQQQQQQQASVPQQSLMPTKTDYVRPYQSSHALPDKSIEELRDNPSSNPMNKFNNLQNGFKNLGTDRMMVVPTAPEHLRQVEAAAPPPPEPATAPPTPPQTSSGEAMNAKAPIASSTSNGDHTIQPEATKPEVASADADSELKRLREENAKLHGKVDDLTDTLKTFMSKFDHKASGAE